MHREEVAGTTGSTGLVSRTARVARVRRSEQSHHILWRPAELPVARWLARVLMQHHSFAKIQANSI